MSRKRFRTIGVLGGMGPGAGACFLERLSQATDAGRDQDHPPVVLFSLPQVPDRTEAVLRGGRSPVPAILRGLRTLRQAGADFAVIACVTAHYYYPQIARRSPLPLISLIDETVAALLVMRPVPKTIGLIATDGTVRSGLIARPLESAGIEVLVPPLRDQKRIMAVIYGPRGIKAGFTSGLVRKSLLDVATGLVRRGARAILAGCTEVPLALGPTDLPVPLIDPMTAGARAAVRLSGAPLKTI